MTPTKPDTASGTAAEVDYTGASVPAVVDAELVPTGDDRPLAWFDDSEWADGDDGDLAPPDPTLLPLIPMNRKHGEGIVDPTTGEKTTTLPQFIPMARLLTRAWWARSFDDRDQSAGGAPDCRSNDGVTGIGILGEGSQLNPSGKCADCPMNTWGTPTIDGKPVEIDGRVARPCNASYEWMVGVPDSAGNGVSLWRLRFGGLAFGPARAFWDSFTKRVPKIAPIGALCKMVLEPTPAKNGTFLVPSFTRLETFRRAQVAPLIAKRDELIEEFRRVVAEENATRTAEVDERDHRVSGPAAGVSTDPHDEEAAF